MILVAVARVHSIVVTNQLSEIERLSQFVDRVTGQEHLTADDNANLNLLLDEIVSNVIRHGFDDAREHRIMVSLAVGDALATIEVHDDGRPFNPLEAAPPDFDAPVEDRIGGLGIHIVRSIARTVGYRREHGRNVLIVTAKLGP